MNAPTLPPNEKTKRDKAAALVAAMRQHLAVIEQFTANADAEALRGNLWLVKLEDSDLSLRRALRTITHDGRATMDQAALIEHRRYG